MSMKRVTITVPEDVAKRLEGVENVSAFFADAVRRVDRRTRLDAIREANEPVVAEEVRAKVRRRLELAMAEAEARFAEQQVAQASASKKAADAKVRRLRDAA